MKNEKEQQTMEIKKTKFFWLYWVAGAILAVLGVFLLPVWENVNVFWRKWASEGISLMLFVILAMYILYLIGGIKKENTSAKNTMRVVEIIVLVVVAILCLLQQFGILDIIGPCFVVGAILWLRGIVCVINAYLYNVKKKDRTIGIVLAGLVGVTLGTLFMVRRFTAPLFIWIISIGLIIVALAAILWGVVAIPQKKKETNE